MLPTPYAYVYNTFANEGAITVGCMDPHNSAYDPTASVHDATKCGTCKTGYTRTDDSSCWKVGSVVVDCSTGATYYGPKGYHKDEQGNWIQDPKHYETFGHTYWGSKIPQEGKPEPRNMYRSWAGDNNKNWKISRTRPTIYVTGFGKSYQYADAQGNKIFNSPNNLHERWKQIKENCGGQVTVLDLSDSQIAAVPGWLSSNANQSGGSSVQVNISPPPTEPTDYSEIEDGVSSQVEPETSGKGWLIPVAALGIGALLIKRLRG